MAKGAALFHAYQFHGDKADLKDTIVKAVFLCSAWIKPTIDKHFKQ